MRITHPVFVASLVALNVMVAGIVEAGEWNVSFTVPMTITGLESTVAKAEIGCSIKDYYGVQLGFSTVQVPIAGGVYSGPPIVVPVHAQGTTSPTQWTCQIIRLYDVNNVYCMPAVNPQYLFCKVKEGAQGGVPYNTLGVSGKF